MIFVPLLHYFKCKNTYSGNEYGLRYRLTPGKRSVPDPEGGEGAVKEESILTVDYWPDPWTLEMTDPALRRQEIFPLTDEGRAAAASCLEDAFNADPERWKNCCQILLFWRSCCQTPFHWQNCFPVLRSWKSCSRFPVPFQVRNSRTLRILLPWFRTGIRCLIHLTAPHRRRSRL